jgi:predicted N-acetyltransferase YhbS
MSDHLTFEPLVPSSSYLNTVVRWIYDEWSKENGDTVEEIRTKLFKDRDIPPSQVAFYKNSLVGFVWISRFKKPEDKGPTLWINGLYVGESHRNKGIGASLVQRAEQLSIDFEDTLYAYTEIPEYYLRLGWHLFKEKDSHGSSVVRRNLAN